MHKEGGRERDGMEASQKEIIRRDDEEKIAIENVPAQKSY